MNSMSDQRDSDESHRIGLWRSNGGMCPNYLTFPNLSSTLGTMNPRPEHERLRSAIREALDERERADKAKRKASMKLARSLKRAQKAGMPVTEIADLAGLSRQGVYDLIGQA